jgi:hypothetical protein
MSKLRGTRSGQKAIMRLLVPANYILHHNPADKELDECIQILRFYVDNSDRGRAWRSAVELVDAKFKGPDGVDYEYKHPFYRNEELLKKQIYILILRVFGIDYNNLPPALPQQPFQDPRFSGSFGPQFVPGAGLRGGPFGGFPGYIPGAAFPSGKVPPGFHTTYPTDLPRYVDKLNLSAPFNETVPEVTRKALASYLGLTMTELLDSWASVERDFDLPEAPYNED